MEQNAQMDTVLMYSIQMSVYQFHPHTSDFIQYKKTFSCMYIYIPDTVYEIHFQNIQCCLFLISILIVCNHKKEEHMLSWLTFIPTIPSLNSVGEEFNDNACGPCECACCASLRRFEPWWPWESHQLQFFIIIIYTFSFTFPTHLWDLDIWSRSLKLVWK